MPIKEELAEYGFNTYEHNNKKFNELKDQFIEMSQLKSNFDIEKFTVKKEGNFIAHNFHFLMRQYSLALSELRRMTIEKEEKERMILENQELLKNGEKKILVYERDGQQEKYIDLYIKQLINRIDMLDLGIVNKAMMVKNFEACRLKLIKLNGGTYPTNEEYQAENPKYWKWFLSKKAINQRKQAKTGVHEGVWENIDYLEEPALINKAYQVSMLNETGGLPLGLMEKKIVKRRMFGYKKRKAISE